MLVSSSALSLLRGVIRGGLELRLDEADDAAEVRHRESHRGFGCTSGLLQPAPGVEPNDHRYRAAMVQHLMANRVRESLKLRGHTVTSFVEALGDVPGMSADRLRRLLRGAGKHEPCRPQPQYGS